MTWSLSGPQKGKMNSSKHIVYESNTHNTPLSGGRHLSLDARLQIEKAKHDYRRSPTTSGMPNESASAVRSFSPARLRIRAASFRRNAEQQAKDRSNALNVVRLPEEVLWKIFLECAHLPIADLEDWGWINVSYVCSTWRQAALRCLKLWTCIDFSTPNRTAISLNRAKGAPLSIRALVKQQNYRQIRNIMNTAHQFNEIHLISSFDDIQPLLETLAHPNPSLTSLTIEVLSCSSGTITYPRPSFLVNEQELPRLRFIELDGAPLYLISHRCYLLTHLTVRNLPRSEHITDLIELLTNLPKLRGLALFHSPLHDDASDHHQQIVLQQLESLTLEGSIRDIATALDKLSLKSSCRLTCVLDQSHDFSEHLWRLCRSIGAHSYSSCRDTPIDTIFLSGKENSFRFGDDLTVNPEFRQSLRIQGFGPRTGVDDAIFDITIGPGAQWINDDVTLTILTSLWRALSLMTVTTLALHNVDIVTQKLWTQIFRTLPRLRVLDIRGFAPFGLAWALLLDVLSTDSDEKNSRFLAPYLNDIYLQGVDCSSGGFMLSVADQVYSYSDLDDSRFLDVLVASLKYRYRHKLHLRSLTINRCRNVVPETVKELKSWIPNIVWDGRTGEKSVDLGLRYRILPQVIAGGRLKHYHRLEVLLS